MLVFCEHSFLPLFHIGYLVNGYINFVVTAHKVRDDYSEESRGGCEGRKTVWDLGRSEVYIISVKR